MQEPARVVETGQVDVARIRDRCLRRIGRDAEVGRVGPADVQVPAGGVEDVDACRAGRDGVNAAAGIDLHRRDLAELGGIGRLAEHAVGDPFGVEAEEGVAVAAPEPAVGGDPHVLQGR
jgi:hypothetical protein